MSKKKSFSGSTMTLKDFHGGSIPSDLPLPSAPGVIVRQADRPSFDRPNAWGNRAEHRLRPSSSGSIRSLDDKTPFLANTANIGRNFDEDERKPLDGGPSGPRRSVSDESVRGGGGGAVVLRSGGGGGGSSYSARVVEGGYLNSSGRPLSSGGGGGTYPNAWGVRKESVGVVVPETVVVSSSPWSAQSTVSKFAQASALDKISSGRWQTKPADVEVIRQGDSPDGVHGRESELCNGAGSVSEREYYENSLVRRTERGLVLEEGVRGGVKEAMNVERVRSPVVLDGKERSSVLYTNDGQPAYPDGKYGGPESPVPPEVSERPKLKLLPRTRPLDAPEPSVVEQKQGFQQQADTGHSGIGGSIRGNPGYEKPGVGNNGASHVKPGVSSNVASHVKPGVSSSEASYGKPRPTSSEAGNRVVERPKLNLKPRSQPVDQSEGRTERERVALFGGARPREAVLKERGVDDVINSHEEVQVPTRIKSDVQRTEIAPANANFPRHGQRTENLPIDHRTGRGNEKREQRGDVQKADNQRKSWRNENWRNNRDPEKHQSQQERPPSPETWRKPVQEPKPANSEASGLRFGKAVSAVELAQAFSRPVSETKPVDQYSGQRGIPGRTQIPFSRLTGPTSRAQINGY